MVAGWIGASALLVASLALATGLRAISATRALLSATSAALTAMADRDNEPSDRERQIRRTGVQLLFRLAVLVAVITTSLVTPLLVAGWLGERAIIEHEAIINVATSWPFVIVSSVGLTVMAIRLGKRASVANSVHAYTPADQLLHRLSFATVGLQLALASIEDRLLRTQIRSVDMTRPLFITGLPRSGTTLLLECFVATGRFASHRYQDMPFILIPWTWDKLSRRFRRAKPKTERAHGDGVFINIESPEALEETLWLANFTRPYGRDQIAPFRFAPLDPTVGKTLRQHFAKVIITREASRDLKLRYVSKNNLNIARLDLLRTLFPTCTIVVPFRDPIQHASSLLRQHQRFCSLHRNDPFIAEYMLRIGHFDFGENLRPINFDGWLDSNSAHDPNDLEFWLRYWCATYGHILEQHAPHVHFVDFDGLCENPSRYLDELGARLEVAPEHGFDEIAASVRPPRSYNPATDAIPIELQQHAHGLHQRLLEYAPVKPDPSAVSDRARSLDEAARTRRATLKMSSRVPSRHLPQRWWLSTLCFGLLTLSLGYLLGQSSATERDQLHRAVSEMRETVRSLAGEPDDGRSAEHTSPSIRAGENVTVGASLDDEKLILISSFFDGLNEVRLLRRDGTVLHRWPLSWFELVGATSDRTPPRAENMTELHGIAVHPNGDLIVNFEYLGTVKVDRCGRPIWNIQEQTHHSITPSSSGGYWILGRRFGPEVDNRLFPFVLAAWLDEILHVSLDGTILERIPLSYILMNSELEHLLTSIGANIEGEELTDLELFHANQVSELTEDMADAYPLFDAGDLLVSLRNYNLVVVLDGDDYKVKWHQVGPFIRQHDPEFGPDGSITLFNNNMYLTTPYTAGRRSNIMRVNPETAETSIVFGGRSDQELFSQMRGKHQPLENGGMFIIEFSGGRAFEIDADGRIVWEYIHRWDEDFIVEITDGALLEPDFFEFEEWSCP